MRALIALALVFVPVVASAEVKVEVKEFALGMRIEPDTVVEVQDFELENAGEYIRARAGRFKNGEYTIGGVVLTWCDAKSKCWLGHAWLGPGEVEVLGLVDLGTAGPFPSHAKSKYERRVKLDKKPKWPALVVRTTTRETTTTASRYGGSKTGEHRHAEISVLSLGPKDRDTPTVLRTTTDDHWPTGAGVTVSFEVAKDGHLIATEQRDIESVSACLRPKPTTVHYKLDEHRRFQRSTDLGHTGCGSH